MLTPLQRPAGALPPARRLQHRAEDHDGAARPRLHDRATSNAHRDLLGRLADAHRAGQAAARPARPAAARRADQPPRSRRAQLARGIPRSGYPHAVILVSHDRFFLDAVVTRITEIGAAHADRLRRQLQRLPGRARRADGAAAHSRSASRTRRSAASGCSSTASATRRPRRRRCRAGSRCSRRIVPIEIPPERKRIHFHFPACAKSGRTVLELKHVRKAYGDARGRSATSTCTSSAAIASRWSGRTAPASRR